MSRNKIHSITSQRMIRESRLTSPRIQRVGSLYFIEVKGKWEGNDDLILTKNEILCSRNEPEKFRLTIMVVDEDGSRPPRYLAGYDFGEPVFAETATMLSLRKLLQAVVEPI